MSIAGAQPKVRRRDGIQTAVGVYAVVLAVIGALASAGGAGYAIVSGQVQAAEAAAFGTAGVVAALLLIALPAGILLWRRWTLVTLWVGVGVPGAALLYPLAMWVIGGWLPLGLLLMVSPFVPLGMLTVWWYASREHVPVPDVVTVPAGLYSVVMLGHEYGPYDADQLVEMARAGQLIPPSALRFNGGATFPAGQVPGLFR